MKIAVVGAEGQLGSQLLRQFADEAVALDLPDFDLTDRRGVVQQLDALRPDVVVNTAAYTQVDRAESEPEKARAVNVEGVIHLVEACRRLDAALVQISTDYVFGGDVGRATPYRETDPPAPLNVYGRTKLDAERVAADLKKHLIVRTSGLYGPASPRGGGNFPTTMLRLAASGKNLAVVDDQHCTPSYTPHVARAVAWLVRRQVHGTYHIVNQGATTWHGFAAELFRLAGRTVELTAIRSDQYPSAAQRPAYSVLDTSRYEALPGRPELPSWREALAEYLLNPTEP
ncbi:MAG TPA: dTDP-4-dehydrorhamnose reductase [Thermoguttaceae bacterium]|nr:dTDP-4-dehydrorhamnose reductase [Thermoguttaceae bacterium]